MNRRLPASLLVALLLALPAAAVAASRPSDPAPAALAWWAELVAQVRSALLPAAARPDGEPGTAGAAGAASTARAARATGAHRGHRLVPACSGAMDPNGQCLAPTCSMGMDPNGHCL